MFGKPIDTNYNNIVSLINTEFKVEDHSAEKMPCWKPVVKMPNIAKGTSNLEFSILESISSIQYDHSDVPDIYECSGIINARADLEFNSEINISLIKDQLVPEISNIKFDPYISSTSLPSTFPIALSLQPPLGNFLLCNYSIQKLPILPIRGFYQLQQINPNYVKILIQLKLADYVNNSFEYCQLQIPFPSKNEIIAFDLVPNSGIVSLHPKKKNILIWNLGTRFSGRNLEVSLPGTIHFDRSKDSVTDPFCIIPNVYIKLKFKILDITLSNLSISKNISVLSKQNKIKNLIIQKNVESKKYIIWNSYGDVRYFPKISENT